VSDKVIVHFPCPTHCSVELTKALRQAAPRLFRVGVRYYKIGVGLVDLASEKYFQFDLFNPAKVDYALMHTLDSINQRYGRDTVFLAAQGIQQKWAMRRDLLTPQYSTQWKCLPKIKC
jgi:DNA polymerase V